MRTETIVNTFREQRIRGWSLRDAWTHARIDHAFEDARSKGLVRFRVEPDPDAFDDRFVDSWGLSERQERHVKQSLQSRAQDEGVWGIVSEVKCPCCGSWKIADDCWQFLGSEHENSGYDWDVKRSALERLSEHDLD